VPVVAGVDSSTQSTKVELRDADTGAVVGHASAPHPTTTPPRSEQDPESWWRAFSSCWTDLHSPAVAAIAVAGQQHGLVAIDEIGRTIRPAKLWNDTESAPDADWLVGQLEGGAAAWAGACGAVPVASFTITKLSWLHRKEPESWAKLDRVLLPHDWMTYRLTGRCTTDRGDASGTGYWSPADSRYRWDLLAIVDASRDWTASVPEVLGPLDDAGMWRGAVVGPGTGDNMGAALGLGIGPGDAVISIGTSGTVYTVSEAPTADPSGTIAGFADASGRFLPLVCTLNASKVIDAVVRLLGTDVDGLSALAVGTPAGAGGVVLLPYFDGERTPNRPLATGVVSGLRSDVSREQLARAAFEGLACSLLDALDALGPMVSATGRLIVTGGGARSAALPRIIADLAGRPVILPAIDQAVAAGACLQAAAVLQQRPIADVQAAWSLGAGRVVEPSGDTDREAVRAAYATRRDHEA
jgi:xylulokinase